MTKESIKCQARKILLRGKRKKARNEDHGSDSRIVQQYFLKITGPMIEKILLEFEFSEKLEDRKIAAKELVAYFHCCRTEGHTDIPNGASVDSYILRFARIVTSRMVGENEEQSSPLGDDYLVPNWTTPNVVFGWDRPDHRPRKDTFLRNLAIFAFMEKLLSEGVSKKDAAERSSTKFDLNKSTIEKIYREWKRDGSFQRQLQSLSKSEVDELVKEFTTLTGS